MSVKTRAKSVRSSARDLRAKSIREAVEQATAGLPSLLAVKVVAEFMAVTTRTILRYIELGDLATVSTAATGPNVRVLKSSLINLLVSGTLARQELIPHQRKAFDGKVEEGE